MLFTAGHNEKYISKAFSTQADCIVFDLEDAVPEGHKVKARTMIREVLKSDHKNKRPLFVRINPLESGHTLVDLDEVACSAINGFIYPKAYNADDIIVFDAQLSLKEKHLGLENGYFDIIVLMETPESILNALEIAKASKRVKGLLFGSEDYLADMGGSHGTGGRSLVCPRNIVSMAAKAAGIIAIDTPYVHVGNEEGLREHIIQARELGYDGMLIMSPRQIEMATQLYTPSPEEVKNARKMVELAEEAVKANRGIAMFDNVFISPPTLRQVKSLLNRYDQIEQFKKIIST
jgi:citrate lyase subunit beta/citryl-CoA lyase